MAQHLCADRYGFTNYAIPTAKHPAKNPLIQKQLGFLLRVVC